MIRIHCILFLLFTLYLPACQTEDNNRFTTPHDDVKDDDLTTPSSDDDTFAEDDDVEDDDSAIVWDWGPPTDTDLVEFVVTCGFIVGQAGGCFFQEDNVWTFVVDETCSAANSFPPQANPDLFDCLTLGSESQATSDMTVEWDEAGHIVFGNPLVHDVNPVPSVENRWLGHFFSSEEAVEDCMSKRAETLGIEYPFILVMDRL